MIGEFIAICVLTLCVFFTAHFAARVCHREEALKPWLPMILVTLLPWIAATCFSVVFHIVYDNPYDGTGHEEHARLIARSIERGDAQLRDFLVLGNHGYRAVLGCFYALTDASPLIIYGINGLCGFAGMLLSLEAACRYFGGRRLPGWLVCVTMLSPSMLLWAPKNLKEGPIILSIGLILGWFCIQEGMRRRPEQHIGMLVGCGMLFFLRPHTAVAWLVGLALGQIQPTTNLLRSIVAGVLLFGVAIGGVLAIEVLMPGILTGISEEGLTNTMVSNYRTRMHIGDTAIVRQSDPIPVLSGLSLVALSPPPYLWRSPIWLVLGLESLAMTSALVLSWLFLPCSWRNMLGKPVVPGVIYVILLMSYYLSYMYNIGLAVRLKMQLLPALLLLISAPVLSVQQVTELKVVKQLLRPRGGEAVC